MVSYFAIAISMQSISGAGERLGGRGDDRWDGFEGTRNVLKVELAITWCRRC